MENPYVPNVEFEWLEGEACAFWNYTGPPGLYGTIRIEAFSAGVWLQLVPDDVVLLSELSYASGYIWVDTLLHRATILQLPFTPRVSPEVGPPS